MYVLITGSLVIEILKN